MWPPVSPIDGFIGGDNLLRCFCIFFQAEDLESNSPNDYVVKLIFVWSCNTIFNKVLCWRTKRAVVISFSCESSCPSGPCMSPFCPPPPPPPCSASSRTFVRSPPPFHLQGFTKGAALFSARSNNPDFPPNSWFQMIKFSLLGNKRILPGGILFEQPDRNF